MQLVIQGEEVFTQDIKQLAKRLEATRIEAITPQAYRLFPAAPQPDIAEYCQEAQLDYGFVPETWRLNQFGLLAMDMDATLINIECLDEIAARIGRKEEITTITGAAMRGEIDFTESLKRRIGLFAEVAEEHLLHVYERRLALNPGAEKLLQTAHACGLKTMLVTGGFTFFAERLQARLKFDYLAANTLEILDGRLSGRILGEIIDAQGKAQAVAQVRDELGLAPEQVICLGDGANDVPMLKAAGVGIAYHAKPVVQAQATYALNYVGLDGVLNLIPPED